MPDHNPYQTKCLSLLGGLLCKIDGFENFVHRFDLGRQSFVAGDGDFTSGWLVPRSRLALPAPPSLSIDHNHWVNSICQIL